MGNEEELLYHATLLKQESEEAENSLNFVNEQIRELESFKEGLKFLDENKEKEILAPFGKGIYLKAEKKEGKLFVNVGDNVLVRKTPKETLAIVEDQTKKFNEAKWQLVAQLESYASQFREMLKDVGKMKDEKTKKETLAKGKKE